MNAAGIEVLPWTHYAPEMREAIKALTARWPAQTVADAAQQFADIIAAHGRPTEPAWVELGWTDAADHDGYVTDLRERTLRLPADAQAWIREQRRRSGIADRGPYSLAQVDRINELIDAAELRNGERTAA